MNMNFLDDAGLANSTAFGDLPFAVESYGVQESEKELAQAALACIEIDQTIEKAAGAACAMESLAGVASDSLADGGVTGHDAAAVMAAADVALMTIGAGGGMQMPAAESYGSNSGFATHAMESFSETMTKIWDTIVEWWNKAKEAVIKWFQKHISSLGRLKIAAKALGEKAEKSDNSPKEKKLEFSKAKYMATEDKLPTSAEADGLDMLNTISDKVISKEAIAEYTTSYIEDMEAVVEGLEVKKENTVAVANTSVESALAEAISTYEGAITTLLGLTNSASDADDKRIKDPKSGGKVNVSDLLTGLARWTGTVKETGTGEEKQGLSLISITFYGTDPAKFKDKDEHEVDALTGGEISEICTKIVEGVDFLQRRDPFKKLASHGKKLKSLGTSFNKKVKEVTDEAGAGAGKKDEGAKALRKLSGKVTKSMTNVTTNARTPVREYIQHVSTVMGAYYSFCSKSYSNLRPDDA